ncbi:hypothetical protein [Mycobacterium intracellulare]|uniref:hypothetical protein n=1 Tax=Mycobacterium intracellulare TaxID=1767 RepID=UPI00080B988D|nr:hypothetical protein [Mycobacterium intracellulare]OCB15095.1 hypothetical protein A5689_26945 [Mycobacterium intracellulare subsp. yongonense]
MSGIREDVAMLLRRHTLWNANHSSIGSEAHCLCGERPKGFPEWTTHVADALMAEFGINRKTSYVVNPT